MPVKIACPKCSKNYTLPDSALGKSVQCKACGTTFKTRMPGAAPATPANPAAGKKRPAQQKPTQQRPAQPVSPDMNEFGLEGGFEKQADIFGSAPQGAGGLQNLPDQDPFGQAAEPIVLGPAGATAAKPANPFESVMTNSSMRDSSARNKALKKKQGRAPADVSAYSTVRIGMMCVFGGVAVMVLISFIILLLTLLGSVLAADGNGMPEGMKGFLGVTILILLGLAAISCVAVLVGQIMCIFAPNANERFNAIGSTSLAGAALIGGIITTLVFGVALRSLAGPKGVSAGAALSVGFGYLFAVLICGALAVAATFMFLNFYRALGQNIKSDALVKVCKQATIAVGVSFAITLIVFWLGLILGQVGLDPKTVGFVVATVGILNWLFSLVAAAVVLRMIWTGISNLGSQ